MKQIIGWKLDKLFQIAIEGPELDSHDFEELFDFRRN